MSKAQILVGPVNVAIDFSPSGKDDASGDNDTADPSTLNTYTDFGFTQEGLVVEIESIVEPVYVDQESFPVQAIAGGPPSERVKATTMLAQATFDKLRAAWAGFLLENDDAGDPKVGSLGNVGGDTLQDLALRFTGTAPSGGSRIVYMLLANAADNSEVSMQRGENRKIPVTFEAVAGIGTEGKEQPLLRIKGD